MYNDIIFAILAGILLFVFLTSRFFRRLKFKWKIFRSTQLLKKIVDDLDSPQTILENARKAVIELRNGYWVNSFDEKYFLKTGDFQDVGNRIKRINLALENNFSFEKIGTSKEELITFRSGKVHKKVAIMKLELFRGFESMAEGEDIVELSVEGGFKLEDIGTNEKEIAALDREYTRRLYISIFKRYKKWAEGEKSFHDEDPREFEIDMKSLLSDHYKDEQFSYEDFDLDEEAYKRLLTLGRKRKICENIAGFEKACREGNTVYSIYREKIDKCLAEAAELKLEDLGYDNYVLNELESIVHINKAKNTLAELKNPKEHWSISLSIQNTPGDPKKYVNSIMEDLKIGQGELSDIGTTESEITKLVYAGHIFSIKYILVRIKEISVTPRRSKADFVNAIFGNKGMVFDTSYVSTDDELERPFPIDGRLKAIEYHLEATGLDLEYFCMSSEKLSELKQKIELR